MALTWSRSIWHARRSSHLPTDCCSCCLLQYTQAHTNPQSPAVPLSGHNHCDILDRRIQKVSVKYPTYSPVTTVVTFVTQGRGLLYSQNGKEVRLEDDSIDYGMRLPDRSLLLRIGIRVSRLSAPIRVW